MKKKLALLSITLILFIMTLVGVNTYARFSSKSSGSTSAKVAGFVLSMDENTTYFPYEFNNTNPSSNAEYYKFQVTNLKNSKVSEVSEKYTLNCLFTRNIPLNIELYKVSQTNYNAATTSSANLTGATLVKSVTYPNAVDFSFNNTFNANTSSTDYYIIKITWNSSYKNDLYQNKIDLFKINATFEQI